MRGVFVMPNSVRNRVVSIMTVSMLVCAVFIGLIQFADEAEGITITVPVDYATIQEAIVAANAGDTIRVWDGVYVENINVYKGVSLIGNSSATTIIDGNQAGFAVSITSDLVNITGFLIINGSSTGIETSNCDHITIDECNITLNNGGGINFYNVYNGTIRNSEIISNNGGISLEDWGTDYATIENCTIYNNSWVGISIGMGASHTRVIDTKIYGHSAGYGIYSTNSNDILIKDSDIWANSFGILFDYCNDATIEGTDIYSNTQNGAHLSGSNNRIANCTFTSNNEYGLNVEYSSVYEIENTSISNHLTGILIQGVPNLKMINSSIKNSTTDISLLFNSHADLLNTTFNKTRVTYSDLVSTMTVRWFMHVYVNDSIGNPVSGARVIVRNATGLGIFDGMTDAAGYFNWITVTEYYENKSQRWLHTAHNITCHDGTDFGWATPDANMTKSKLVKVSLTSPMPTIDYIVIEDAIGGNAIGAMVYRIEDIIDFHSIAYNNSMGFIGPVPATWSSNNTGVGDVVIAPTSKTTFTAISEGTCFVTAIYGIAIDATGVLTIIWLVENLDQLTVHPTIQKAIDRANPGDTLLAKPWTYYERVQFNKTVTLLGTDKSNTIVHGSWLHDAFQVSANWVNISGFSAIKGSSGISVGNVINTRIDDCLIYSNIWVGIGLWNSDFATINNTEIHSNQDGIYISDIDNDYNTITECYIHDNKGNGIHLQMNVRNTWISDCNITGNGGNGIYLENADDTTVMDCDIWNNNMGIVIEFSTNTNIEDCNIYSNYISGISVNIWGNNNMVSNSTISSNNQNGIVLDTAMNFVVENTIITNHTKGIRAIDYTECLVANSSIVNTPPANDFYVESNSKITALNTTFNKKNVTITTGGELWVKWFMHVIVTDIMWNPVSGAEFLVQNVTGALVLNDYTDADGSIRWITVTEYYQNQTQLTYHTPHVIRATIGANIVSKNATMDKSKFVMLQLDSLQPAVALQLVAGLQYSTVNVDYDIIASVTQDDQPRMHTADTVISITIYDDDMNKVVDGDSMSLLDSDLGLYSYSNITSGEGVYFVIAHLTASGVTGIGLTSFEMVGWIEDISNVNDSLGQIRDALDYINLTTAEVNQTLDGFITGFGDFWNQFNGTDMSNLTNLLDWFNVTMDMIRNFESNITTLLADQNIDMARIDGNITAIDTFMQQAFSNLYENHTTTRDIISAYWDDWNSTIAQINNDIDFLNATLLLLASDMGLLNVSLNDLQNDIDYMNQTLPVKIDDLAVQLSGVNDSLVSTLNALEGNILTDLQNVNASLANDIQNLLNAITNEILGLNTSLTGQLANLNVTANTTDLETWLGLVLGQIDTNLTNARNALSQQLDDLNTTMLAFHNEILMDLMDVHDSLSQLESNLSAQHTTITDAIDTLNDTIAGVPGLSTQDILDKINESIAMLSTLDSNVTTYSTDIQDLQGQLMGLVQDQGNMTRDQLLQNVSEILGQMQDLDADIVSHDDDVKQNLTTLQDLINNIGAMDLSDIMMALADLEGNLSAYDTVLASDIAYVQDSVVNFQTDIEGRLEEINDTLDEIAKLEDIMVELEALETNILAGQQQLDDEINEIPTEKEEKEEGFGLAVGLLIVVILLLLVNLLLTFTGKGKNKEEEPKPLFDEEENEEEEPLEEDEDEGDWDETGEEEPEEDMEGEEEEL